MTLSWLLAALHLIALGLGQGGVRFRAKFFRDPLDDAGLRRLFMADALWGIAALLWIGTGLYRALSGVEKGAAYYFSNPLFHAKLGLFGVIFLLEFVPMILLLQWRMARKQGKPIDTSKAKMCAVISDIQSLLLIVIVVLAAGIARNYGAR